MDDDAPTRDLLLYLDANCFQRSFDDPSQVRVQLEATACQELFRLAGAGVLRLAWSFMHADEIAICPFPDRVVAVTMLSVLCDVRVGPNDDVRGRAVEFAALGLQPKDALHVAAAEHAGAAYFVSCDDRLLKQARRLNLRVQFVNPVNLIQELGDE